MKAAATRPPATALYPASPATQTITGTRPRPAARAAPRRILLPVIPLALAAAVRRIPDVLPPRTAARHTLATAPAPEIANVLLRFPDGTADRALRHARAADAHLTKTVPILRQSGLAIRNPVAHTER